MSISAISYKEVAEIINKHDISNPDSNFVEGGKGLTTLGHRVGTDIGDAIDVYVGQLAHSYRAKIQEFRAKNTHQTFAWKKLSRSLAEAHEKIAVYQEAIAEGRGNKGKLASSIHDEVAKARNIAMQMDIFQNVKEMPIRSEFLRHATFVADAVVNALKNEETRNAIRNYAGLPTAQELHQETLEWKTHLKGMNHAS